MLTQKAQSIGQLNFFQREDYRDYELVKKDNIIQFPKAKNNLNITKQDLGTNISTSLYTSHGKPKATAADSIKTLEEIELIKKYFLDRKEYRNYCLFIVGITTGYRCSDLLSLKFSNFFNEDYSWKIEIDIIEKKTKKRRRIIITDNIKKAINLYIDSLGGCIDLDSYIFKSQKGVNRPIDKSYARRIFNNMAIDLKLPYHCSTHFLRKTFAYWFLQIHKNDMTALATLQEILNHSSEKMTLKYCGIEKQKQKEMIMNLSELW